MAISTSVAENNKEGMDSSVRVNDVVLIVATANGSGSQSANNVIVRTIFQMGIPVGAKNLFPSNIAGMPTWFNIRASKDGWTGRRADPDILVLLNPDSVKEDLAKATPGTIILTRDDMELPTERTDLEVIVAPFTKLAASVCEVPRLRKMVLNMVYVGVLGYLLQMDMDEVKMAISKQFHHKEKATDLNWRAALAGYEWARENVKPLERFRLERMDATKNKVLVDGNTVCALGAVWGGVTVIGWYPITPSTTMTETIIDLLHELRHDPQTGKASYAVVQAEDELAAMGIIVGAGWAGARSLTTTSGPGMSLMAELAGLSYFAEIPCVIASVQRMGPSTGLPTRTCQGDISKAYYLSHGDCKHLLLLPGNLKECFEFTAQSMDYAERFQTLVFVMIDLDMGMNLWMGDEFEQPTKPIDRGKVLTAEDLERLGGEFGRYRDVDGDGIPYRTLPGTRHPKAAYFTRGTGHTDKATYCETPQVWQGNLDRLTRKFETARRELPAPILHTMEKADFGILAYGSSDLATAEASFLLGQKHGLGGEYMRLRALPAHPSVREFIEKHPRVYLVDQNRDAQVASILRAEWPEVAGKIRSILHYDGTAIDAQSIVDQIMAQETGRQEGME